MTEEQVLLAQFLERIASILASEIECGLFEMHVAPALEIARKSFTGD